MMKLSCSGAATRLGDKPYNEDAFFLGETFCGVFDGATGLTEAAPVMADYPSDAAWFVAESKRYLGRHLSDTTQTIQQICQAAMAVCREQWQGGLSANAIPSAGLALARQNGTALECFCLGDVSLSVRLASGVFLSFPESELSSLDHAALQEAIAYRKRGHCWSDAIAYIRPMLQEHRRMRNQPGGYAALDLLGQWPKARTATLPLAQAQSIFLCSDGFAQLIDFGIAKNLSDLHRNAEEQGIEPLLSRLTKVQQADPDCLKVARFKCMDDATAVILRRKDCGEVDSLL